MSVFAICVCRYYNAVLNEDESEYSSSLVLRCRRSRDTWLFTGSKQRRRAVVVVCIMALLRERIVHNIATSDIFIDFQRRKWQLNEKKNTFFIILL